MNDGLKAKWVEALRSGKYRRGNSYLRSDAGWTCLGVLCDVLDSSKWERHGDGVLVDYFWKYDGQSWFLPNAILHETKLDPIMVPLLYSCQDGKSFAEIADWIDLNIPADES